MEDLEKFIMNHRFLEGLDKKCLEKVLHYATAVDFSAGKFIFKQGEQAEYFYLLTKGRVAVQLDSPEKGNLLVETLNAGDVLGWSWLVPPFKWRFNALTTATTQAIAIQGEPFRALCEEDHELGFEIMKRFLKVIAARLEVENLQIMELYGLNKTAKV